MYPPLSVLLQEENVSKLAIVSIENMQIAFIIYDVLVAANIKNKFKVMYCFFNAI